jgi:hypothetical protein
LFGHACRPNTNAMLEIRTPTAEDTSLATERVNGAFPLPAKTPAVSSVARLASS